MHCRHIFFGLMLVFALAPAALAQSLEQAAQQAANQNDAKILSATTIQDGDRQVHVIKLLTADGVVKVVRVSVRERKSK
jgi:hypothetical protein